MDPIGVRLNSLHVAAKVTFSKIKTIRYNLKLKLFTFFEFRLGIIQLILQNALILPHIQQLLPQPREQQKEKILILRLNLI